MTEHKVAAAIQQALDCLSERERQVVVLRYGLEEHACHSLEEVGRALGITRERVRQIEKAALRRLDQEAGPLRGGGVRVGDNRETTSKPDYCSPLQRALTWIDRH